ncbi:DUF6185 family protein [Streptomyces hesseae]|uniref:DUF6185 family protein n=1 Tax=Streptomyces hesseae TaxID=3075519 RepID=A0ABU2SXT9_9ACTN|nr:DUF6185 family protein [Streptomyces sp. DSM 40473]MDT0453827.1 DUF6185 family protein [Streptomyces sp. DSM 40473]
MIPRKAGRPGWRWAVLAVAAFAAFAAFGWWMALPAQAQTQAHARATEATDCPPIRQPEKIDLRYKLTFDQHHIDFAEVRQLTSIDIPAGQWPLSNDLTLSTDSPKYRNAMRCLLHEKRATEKFGEWHPEWRNVSEATEQQGVVAVRYESWNLVGNSAGQFEVGPWTVDAEPDKNWKVALHSPEVLRGVSRRTVEIDPGGLEIGDAPGASSANETRRVWTPPGPDTEASIMRPKQLTPLSRRDSLIAYLGVTSWWVFGSALIALSAWPFRKKNGKNDKAAARTLADTALQWAGLSAALALTLALLLQLYPATSRWRAFIGISSGLALVLLAQPWLPLVERSGDGRKVLTRRTVLVTTFAAAAIGLLVILSPQLFGLSSKLMPTAPAPPLAIAGLALLETSMLWLWFTAMAAWAWRFAREGKLGGSSTGDGRNQAGRHLRRVTATGAALAVVAALVVLCHVLSFESRWRRANWLGEADSLFGNDHTGILGRQLAEFPSFGPLWTYTHTSVLTAIALVALLRLSSRARSGAKSLGPKGWDLLLVAAIFAVVLALRVAKFAGSAANLYGLWLPLNMLALYALVKAGRRWSTLGRVDRKAEKCFAANAAKGESRVAAELTTPAGYRRMMGDARRCRDLLHRLHLVDHGHPESAQRRTLENQLSALHHWRPAKCSRDCLPDPVSVVDVALCWGPRRRWWRNALNAARWAAVFGVLPSVVTVWYENAYDPDQWALTLDLPTGIPDVVWRFLTQEISFAGAGLVLGALWRVLPGERGPMRALSLFVAWLVPIGVVAAFSHGIDRKALGLALLNIVLMLMVLTLTSMWMDTDTFSRERPYWTKRLSLLASIYQMHGLSGQVAFLVMQAAAAVTIWRQIATG